MKVHRFLAALLPIATLQAIACTGGEGVGQEQQAGHYESNYSDAFEAEKLKFFEGQQAVVAEHSKTTREVIVSLEALTRYHKEQLIAEILKAQAAVLLVVPHRFSKGINNQVFDGLKGLVDASELSRIKLLYSSMDQAPVVWARDWGPLVAESVGDGRPRVLDFNYYPERQTGDVVPRDMIQKLLSANATEIERLSIPVYNEGGNFMSNHQKVCMMTTRVVEANATIPMCGGEGGGNRGDTPCFANDRILSQEQIAEYYQKYAGCSAVKIFPRMPHEGTGHIDMWAKFIDDQTILVSDLQQHQLDTITDPYDKAEALDIQAYLRQRQTELAALGYQIEKLPIPVPYYDQQQDTVIYRSYTNSLLVNDVALIPRYTRTDYPDQALQLDYEQAVMAAYQKAGFKAIFIDSDDLILDGGAVHCVTMQSALALFP